MVPDADIWRAATLLIRQHGDKATRPQPPPQDAPGKCAIKATVTGDVSGSGSGAR